MPRRDDRQPGLRTPNRLPPSTFAFRSPARRANPPPARATPSPRDTTGLLAPTKGGLAIAAAGPRPTAPGLEGRLRPWQVSSAAARDAASHGLQPPPAPAEAVGGRSAPPLGQSTRSVITMHPPTTPEPMSRDSVQTAARLIRDLGFPVVVAMYLLWRLDVHISEINVLGGSILTELQAMHHACDACATACHPRH